MSSSLSLRRFASSRLLRVTALLAWLLMTLSLQAASFEAIPGQDRVAYDVAAMTMDHAMHADAMTAHGHHADHCCGDTAHPACHCAAMCGAVMLPAVPAWHGPMQLAAVQVPVRGLAAPTPNLIPPLRPPLAWLHA
jgi:hypothetical protein